MDYAIALILALWLIACIYTQIVPETRLRYVPFDLIPVCRFFAPRPVSKDLVVYVRTANEDGSFSPWRPLAPGEKRWFCFAWNPRNRIRKAVSDLARLLSRFRYDEDARHVSYPYLCFLNAATGMARRTTGASKVQFVLAAHAGYENPKHTIVFTSHVHDLGAS